MARTEPSLLTQDELRSIAEQQTSPAISIYFPTVRANVTSQENSLHLKSLLGEVNEQLKGSDLGRKELDALLGPLQELVDDTDFWMHQLEGLALFRTSNMFKIFRLPFPVAELAHVSDVLKLTPLFPRLPGNNEWHILCFSKGEVRLLHCTLNRVEPVDLSGTDFPKSLAEALKFDDLSKPDGLHHEMSGPGARTVPSGDGSRDRAFHGHGEDGDEEKTQIWRYARLVDEGLVKLLPAGGPLMLACVDYLAPIYRDASHYNDLIDEVVEGNPDGLRDDEVHERALPLIEERAEKQLSDLFERFGTAMAHDQAGVDLAEILIAAEQGRIDTLFVERDATRWGRWDPTGGGLTVHDERAPDDVDLCDLAAQKTLLSSGSVLTLAPDRMPGGGEPIAALYRYPLPRS
jgi:Bacterial archaeo-eukaryotic release factor family 7